MIRFLNVYYPTRTILLFLSEVLIVGGCFLAALLMLMGSDAYITLNYEHGIAKLLILTAVTIVFSYYFNLYEPQLLSDRKEIYFRILLVLGCVCFFVSAILYFFPDFGIARYVFSLGFSLLAIALILWRRAYAWIAGKDIFREQVYILGNGDSAGNLAQTIGKRRDLGLEVVGLDYSLPSGGYADSATAAVQTLLDMKRPVHRVIIAMQDRRGELPVRELMALRFRGVVIEDAGALLERMSGKIYLAGLRPSSFLYAEGFRIKPSQQITRRIASTLAAAVGLVLFAPFFPIVLLLVRLSSPGPIFFRQVRVGLAGRNFTVYKFRTMRQDAEANGAKWASKNDPRVTRFGMLMRKTRIDEIPQLWNVLRGDMAFVGPRPERPEFVPWLAEQLPFYNLRHMIRPGLTGWAQIRYGYGATLEESREKLEFDLYYVKHASLGLDLLIMFETIKTILHRRGAQ